MKAKVGLVLSGGMGKGAYQIGALRVITEYIKPEDFTMVSASSVGAVNAYSFLIGHLDDMTGIWESANPEGRRQFITYVLKSPFIQDTIETIAGWGGSVPCPLYIPLLNLAKRKLSYYDFSAVSQDDIRSYLTASVAMPFYNKGVKIADEVLYDGAVVDNIPVYPLIDKDLDYIICICFDDSNFIFESPDFEKKLIKLTFHDGKFISNSVIIRQESIRTMLKDGEEYASSQLSRIFSCGTDDIDAVHEAIRARNMAAKENTGLRITGDVIVDNMNKLVNKLVRRGMKV